MKEERKQLIEKERKLYYAVWDKMGQDHNNMFPILSSQRNTDGMSDRAFELHETRSQESWKKYVDKMVSEEYILNIDKFIQAYNDIIEVCDKTFKIIQEICDKNGCDSIKADMINNYTNVKESSNAIIKELDMRGGVDLPLTGALTPWQQQQRVKLRLHMKIKARNSSLECDYDWVERTMPLIRILHIEYVKVLDYQRLVKFQQKAELTEEEAISIIHYLIGKNLTSFYFKIDKYHENTLLVKKVMNRFSQKHGIRPEDTLEVFQEYIGNAEESKRIMKHENIKYG